MNYEDNFYVGLAKNMSTCRACPAAKDVCLKIKPGSETCAAVIKAAHARAIEMDKTAEIDRLQAQEEDHERS